MPKDHETPGDAYRQFGRAAREQIRDEDERAAREQIRDEETEGEVFARRFAALDYLDRATVRANACMILAAVADVMERDGKVIDAAGLRETAANIGSLAITEALLPGPFGSTPPSELEDLIKADVSLALGVLATAMTINGLPFVVGAMIGRMARETMEEIMMAVLAHEVSDGAGDILDMLATVYGQPAGQGPEPGADAMRAVFEATETEITKTMREMGI
jgi:hypothetical protein